MSLILCIDTATEYAGVCFCDEGKVIAMKERDDPKNHAAFVQSAIAEMQNASGIHVKDADAIAVTNGPGSYTGLRVGLASAKGLCYALNKPLILLNTLEVMALASAGNNNISDVLYCPMIDARRMEVFTAVYNSALEVVLKPCAMVLNEKSFEDLLEKNRIIFSGSGHGKFQTILHNSNALFDAVKHNMKDVATQADHALAAKNFGDIAYSAPVYLKEFFTNSPNA